MSDKSPPDHVSVDPESPNYFEDYRKIDVYFDGKKRKNDVAEYCVSEGWLKKFLYLQNGKIKRERGKPILIKMRGKIEAKWR